VKILRKLFSLFWNKDERRLRAFWRMIIYLSVLLILNSILLLVMILFVGALHFVVKGEWPAFLAAGQPLKLLSNRWVGNVIAPGVMCLASLLSTFVIGKWVDRRKFRDFGFHFSKTWWGDFGFGLALGAVLMTGIFLLGVLTGTLRVVSYFESNLGDISFSVGMLQYLILFVMVGIYEEVLFRGYYFVNLAEGLNSGPVGRRNALIIAWGMLSIVFGLFHFSNPNATWVSTIMIMAAGVFLGTGMALTGSLAIPIGLHITWNFFQGNIYGFAVSGMQAGVSLVATESIGPAWFTGGVFGPEAGVIGLAAMLVGVLLIVLRLHRRGTLRLGTEIAVFFVPNNQENKH
jgi:membrane protease YdiL (CAAX protease family)